MNLFLSILITSFILIIIFKFRFKVKKNSRKKSKLKYKLVDWMELTDEERREMDFRDKRDTLERKKILLKSIREEYKKLKKK